MKNGSLAHHASHFGHNIFCLNNIYLLLVLIYLNYYMQIVGLQKIRVFILIIQTFNKHQQKHNQNIHNHNHL